jgi:hypothetical protein
MILVMMLYQIRSGPEQEHLSQWAPGQWELVTHMGLTILLWNRHGSITIAQEY